MTSYASTFDPVAFSVWLRAEREKQGFSLRDLAARAGMHNTSLSYIEIKSQDVPVAKFCAICEALGADPATKLKDFIK